MLTLKEIKSELNILMLTNPSDHKETELNKIKKRIQFLKLCEKYLESNPSPEFVSQEHKRILKIINTVADRFSTWAQNNPQAAAGKDYRAQKSFYEKENGVPKLRKQLKTLAFIKHN